MILKNKVCEALLLALLDGGKDFVVYSDVSMKDLRRVLMQCGKVITYHSQKLKKDEMRYSVHDLELSAIVFTLKIRKHYVYDT